MTEPWADGPPPNPAPPGLPPEEKPQGIGPWILAGVICTAAVIAVIIAVVVVVNGDDKKSASDSKAGAGSSSQGSSTSAPTSSSQPAPNTSTDAPQSPTATSTPSPTKPTQTPVAPTNKQTAEPTAEPTDEPQDSGALGIVDACNQASSASSQKISTNPSVGISSGQPVYVMTSLLYYVGYIDVATSSFTSSVESLVIDYQSSRGLFADGIVGPDTWAQLIADAC